MRPWRPLLCCAAFALATPALPGASSAEVAGHATTPPVDLRIGRALHPRVSAARDPHQATLTVRTSGGGVIDHARLWQTLSYRDALRAPSPRPDDPFDPARERRVLVGGILELRASRAAEMPTELRALSDSLYATVKRGMDELGLAHRRRSAAPYVVGARGQLHGVQVDVSVEQPTYRAISPGDFDEMLIGALRGTARGSHAR